MAKWLFNSQGAPIAFVSENKVFSRSGSFVGRIDGTEVWHGSYKGEIYGQERFLYKTSKGSVQRGTPGIPGIPGIPGLPGHKGGIAMPAGFRDAVLK